MRTFKIDCATADQRLDRYSFDSHLAASLDPLREEFRAKGGTPTIDWFVLDISKVTEADNYGLLGLVLLCQQLDDKFGAEIDLVVPTDYQLLYDFYIGGYRHLLPESVIVRTASDQLEIKPSSSIPASYFAKRICTIDDILELDGEVRMASEVRPKTVDTKLAGDTLSIEDHLSRFLTIGAELTQNVLQHSEQGTQRAPTGYVGYRFLEDSVDIAVMDLGIGIPASLGYGQTTDESITAIRKACEKSVSSVEEQRGLGLYLTKEAVTKMGGEMSIRSGQANVVFNSANKYYGEQEHACKTPFFSGTQIQLSLPLNTEREDNDDENKLHTF